MSVRTPLSRVLGLGAAGEGVGHWWVQRLTAVALVPLTLWFAISLLQQPALDYDSMRGWMAEPLHATVTLLLVLVAAWHSSLGVQVVIEDYVHHAGLKLAALVTSKYVHAVIAVAGAFAVIRIAAGGAA